MKSVMIICADKPCNPSIIGKMEECINCRSEIFLSDSSLNSLIKNNYNDHHILLYCRDCAMWHECEKEG